MSYKNVYKLSISRIFLGNSQLAYELFNLHSEFLSCDWNVTATGTSQK